MLLDLTVSEPKPASLEKLPGANCSECPLIKARVVPPHFPKNGAPVLVGESPGRHEAAKGRPFVGMSGWMLERLCDVFGLPWEDANLTNAVACYPHIILGKEAYALASECCRERLRIELAGFPLETPVLALGYVAQQALGIDQRDRWVYEKLTGKWAIGTYHPAYCMRETQDFAYLVAAMKKFVEPRRLWPEPPDNEYGEAYMVIPPADGLMLLEERWVKFWNDTESGALFWQHLTELPDFDTHPFFAELADEDYMCLDLETDQVDPKDDRLIVFGLSKPAIPGGDPRQCGTAVLEVPYWVMYTPEFTEWVNELFQRYGSRIGGHNLKFDALFLHFQCALAHPDKLEAGWDTILMLSILHDTWFRNLKEAVTYFFDVYDYEGENIAYLDSKSDKFSKIPPEQICKYLVLDIHYNLMLFYQLREELQKIKLQRNPGKTQYEMPYLHLTQPLGKELTAIEYRGVAIDRDRVEDEWKALGKELEGTSAEVEELTGGVVTNANSPQQCAHYMYDVLRFPLCKVHGLTKRSTAKAALEVHKGRHPFIELLRHHRRVQKIRGSYFGQLRKFAWLDPENVWRVFPRYLQFNVVTGRLSARAPSIQTIPRADDREEGQYGVRIKNCIISRPGWCLFSVDGSQWELRVVTCESQDPYLLETYRAGVDFHGRMCDVLFGEGNWGKEDRGQEKRIMFAYVYGGTLQSSLNVYEVNPGAKAEMGRRFNEQLQVLVEWRSKRFLQAQQQGFLESPLGRRVHFQLITDYNRKEVAKWAMNYPIQGTASDITLLASLRAGPQLRALGAYPTITVHDSLIGESPIELIDEVVRVTANELEQAGSELYPDIPWVGEAEVHYDPKAGFGRWGSLVEVDLKGGQRPSEVLKGMINGN